MMRVLILDLVQILQQHDSYGSKNRWGRAGKHLDVEVGGGPEWGCGALSLGQQRVMFRPAEMGRRSTETILVGNSEIIRTLRLKGLSILVERLGVHVGNKPIRGNRCAQIFTGRSLNSGGYLTP